MPPCATSSRERDFHVLEAGDLAAAVEAAGDVWPHEDQHVERWARQRLNLKPGVTRPWQVFGRGGIPFAEMVRLDYLYVTNWSLRATSG